MASRLTLEFDEHYQIIGETYSENDDHNYIITKNHYYGLKLAGTLMQNGERIREYGIHEYFKKLKNSKNRKFGGYIFGKKL